MYKSWKLIIEERRKASRKTRLFGRLSRSAFPLGPPTLTTIHVKARTSSLALSSGSNTCGEFVLYCDVSLFVDGEHANVVAASPVHHQQSSSGLMQSDDYMIQIQ